MGDCHVVLGLLPPEITIHKDPNSPLFAVLGWLLSTLLSPAKAPMGPGWLLACRALASLRLSSDLWSLLVLKAL